MALKLHQTFIRRNQWDGRYFAGPVGEARSLAWDKPKREAIPAQERRQAYCSNEVGADPYFFSSFFSSFLAVGGRIPVWRRYMAAIP
jgi:hypothetical protein